MLLISILIYAVPAKSGIFKVTQPDGTEIELVLNGDEYSNFITSVDGFLLKKNDNRFYHYATMNKDGVISTTKFIYHVPEKRTDKEKKFINQVLSKNNFREISKNVSEKRYVSLQQQVKQRAGERVVGEKGIVLLVNFSDVKFLSPTANSDFNALMNKQGYSVGNAIGSSRDYFIASSDSIFKPNFDVYGPYDLLHDMEYYGGNNTYGNDQRANLMIQHACDLAYQDGIDFSQYDTDGDGYVDNVFVFYAGYSEAEGASSDAIWPHRSVVYTKPQYNGVRVYDYACGSELKGKQGGVMAGIGTFCHEFSHVLGLPDLYNTQDKKSVVYSWDIMDGGCYNLNGDVPCLYSAYETFFCGWLKPTLLECENKTYSLTPLTQCPKQAFLVSNTSQHNLDGNNPDPAQFFILEHRKKELWDKGLPATGMLIWKINYSKILFNYNNVNTVRPYKVDIVRADNNESSYTLARDIFGAFGYYSHSFVWDDGTAWDKSLENITVNTTDNSIKFDYYCKKPSLPNDDNDKSLTVKFEDGNVIISINKSDIKDSKGNPLDIYIFSLTGQLVGRIPHSSFADNPGQVVISGLLQNNTYIISLGAKRKNKYVKVFVK